MKKFFILFFCLFYTVVANAKLTATVDTPNISEEQLIELHISSDAQKTGQPDISVLNENFDIQTQSSGVSFQNINGNKIILQDFTLGLYPKKTGVLVIPSILWDNEKTEPLEINVVPAGQTQKTENEQEITISGSILENQIYENAALTYRAKVLSPISVLDYRFIPPIMVDGEVIPLGASQLGQITKDGKVFQTLTQDYAIFPSKVGKNQLIKGASFQGILLKKRNFQHDMLDPFGFNDGLIYAPVASNRKEILLRAQEESVNVLPRPSDWGKKWWLPAKQVSATQSFSPELDMIKVGDSLTRTIEIKAIGALGTQLPDIVFTPSSDFKVYAETPQKNSGYEQNLGLVGTLKQSFVFVPLHSGKITLPSMTLYWFDLNENVQKQVVLPKQEVNILPSEKEVFSEVHLEKTNLLTQNTNLTVSNPYEKENNLLFFVAGICSGLIVGLIVFLAMRQKRKKQLPDLYPKA